MNTDDLETPPWLFNHYARRIRFTIDAAASDFNHLLPRYWTFEDNALIQDWSKEIVWCNPPYSKPRLFLERAASAEAAVCLVKGDPSTQWWRDYVEGKATVIWLPKRVKFLYRGKPTKHTASFPSAILLYGFQAKNP